MLQVWSISYRISMTSSLLYQLYQAILFWIRLSLYSDWHGVWAVFIIIIFIIVIVSVVVMIIIIIIIVVVPIIIIVIILIIIYKMWSSRDVNDCCIIYSNGIDIKYVFITQRKR